MSAWTLWQPKAAAATQISLGLTGVGESYEIATDASGHAVRLTVDCSRFTEPVAEGG